MRICFDLGMLACLGKKLNDTGRRSKLNVMVVLVMINHFDLAFLGLAPSPEEVDHDSDSLHVISGNCKKLLVVSSSYVVEREDEEIFDGSTFRLVTKTLLWPTELMRARFDPVSNSISKATFFTATFFSAGSRLSMSSMSLSHASDQTVVIHTEKVRCLKACSVCSCKRFFSRPGHRVRPAVAIPTTVGGTFYFHASGGTEMTCDAHVLRSMLLLAGVPRHIGALPVRSNLSSANAFLAITGARATSGGLAQVS